MEGKKGQTTKSKIVSAAWILFHKKGYDNTTLDEIIEASGTSKGSFYHYFNGKDALLGTLSTLFDDKYEELLQEMDPEMDSFDKLLYLNKELFTLIDNSVDRELIASLYSSQLITKGERHLMDQNRIYYRLLLDIITEGQRRNQISRVMAPHEITRIYALCERALIYDWCISQGIYSLAEYTGQLMPMFLNQFKVSVSENT